MKNNNLISMTISTLMAATAITACSGEEPPTESDSAMTASQALCQSVADYVQQCGAVTPCDDALVADCSSVVGIFSDAMITSVQTCMSAEGHPLQCLIDGVTGLQPTETHLAFGAKVCDTCTGGIGADSCKEAFFSPESEFKAGALVAPFSDAIVQKISDACVVDLLSCASLPSCLQEQLLTEAIPENTLTCVVDSLSDPSSLSIPAGCSGESAESGNTTGTGAQGGAGGQGAGGQGAGGDGTGGGEEMCVDCSSILITGGEWSDLCGYDDASGTCAPGSSCAKYESFTECVCGDPCYVECQGTCFGGEDGECSACINALCTDEVDICGAD